MFRFCLLNLIISTHTPTIIFNFNFSNRLSPSLISPKAIAARLSLKIKHKPLSSNVLSDN